MATSVQRARVRESTGGWVLAVALPLAISLVCLRSFTSDGYLLQVDIVFGPRPGPVPAGLGAPVALLQAAAVELLGGEIAGRLYAAGALFLAGFAPMVLLRRAPWYARCAGAFVGALNPWVYDRMVEGQWGVVVAARRAVSLGGRVGGAAGEPRGAAGAGPGADRRRSRRVRSPHARAGRSARDRRWPVDSHLAGPRTARLDGRIVRDARPCCCRTASSRSSSATSRRLRDGEAVHARRLRVLPFRLERRLWTARQPGRAVRVLGRARRPVRARERGRLMVAGHQRGDRRRRARRGLAPAPSRLAARLRSRRPCRERQHRAPGRP